MERISSHLYRRAGRVVLLGPIWVHSLRERYENLGYYSQRDKRKPNGPMHSHGQLDGIRELACGRPAIRSGEGD